MPGSAPTAENSGAADSSNQIDSSSHFECEELDGENYGEVEAALPLAEQTVERMLGIIPDEVRLLLCSLPIVVALLSLCSCASCCALCLLPCCCASCCALCLSCRSLVAVLSDEVPHTICIPMCLSQCVSHPVCLSPCAPGTQDKDFSYSFFDSHSVSLPMCVLPMCVSPCVSQGRYRL